MKKITILSIAFLLSIITGCSDDTSVTSPASGGLGVGGGGTGGGSVTFTISSTTGQQGEVIFNATPSVSVKITKVTVSLPAQQFTDPLAGDGTTVYNANQLVTLETYTGVSSGQQWTFQFEGSLSSNNETFNVTSNYTIP